MTAPTEPHAAPDLLYSETEEDLRAAVRALLTDRCDAPGVIARTETDTPYDPALWKALATDIGVAGLLVPEERGGQGAGPREAAVVLEELGRGIAPVPYLTSSVVATATLLALDAADGPAAALLTDLAEGRRTAALAAPFSTAPGDTPLWDAPLDGTRGPVADAATADILLVPAADGLYAVAADAPGVTVMRKVERGLHQPVADHRVHGAEHRHEQRADRVQ
ncbi:acyl-CoA dehydrogenase family protein, partial [Streptomyces sp. NPDC001478]